LRNVVEFENNGHAEVWFQHVLPWRPLIQESNASKPWKPWWNANLSISEPFQKPLYDFPEGWVRYTSQRSIGSSNNDKNQVRKKWYMHFQTKILLSESEISDYLSSNK
jgi:hypothetical protein